MPIVLILFTSFSVHPASEAWNLLTQENQILSSRIHYEGMLQDNPQDSLAHIGWFLSFAGQGPTVELLEACKTVLKRVPPGSPAAEFVLMWMQPLADFFPGFHEYLADSLLQPLPDEITTGSFPVIKSNYLMSLAKNRADDDLYQRARSESRTINKWLFSNRVGQYPIPDFYKPWTSLQWDIANMVESQNGTLVPPSPSQGPGVFFATSRVDNPENQQVQIRLFSYQNVDLFVDGERLLRQLKRENLGSAIQNATFFLKKGMHELVVKSTQTQQTDGQFQIQLAASLPLVFPEPAPPQLPLTDKKIKASPYYSGLEKLVFESKDDGPHSSLVSFVSALVHLRSKNIEPAVTILESLIETCPKSQLIGGQLTKVYLEGIPFMSQERQLGRAYNLLEKLSQNPEGMYPENQLLLASVLIKANKVKDALYLLQDLVQQNPGYCEALELLLSLAKKENLLDVKADVIQKIEMLGTDHRWAQETLLTQARLDQNMDNEKMLLANLTSLFPWGKYESEYNKKNGDFQAAIESLKKHMKYFPGSAYYPFSIAELYNELGDTSSQYHWLEETLAMDPTHKWALIKIVNMDLYNGKKEQAMKRMEEFLVLVPHDGTIRQMRSHLQGRTYFEPFRVNSSMIIQQAASKPKSEGADSELLLDQLMVRLFPDGSQMRYTHLVTRVLTKKGVDMESEVQLPPNCEILEMRTIKPDGSVFFPEDIENKNTLSLSSVSVGDFIDQEHIEYIAPAYYDQDGLDGSMSFIFQGVDRIYHHSECVLIYPNDLQVEPEYFQKNFPGDPERTETDGLVYLRWLAENVPPLILEPAMPDPAQIMPKISFSYQTSWEEIRDFFMNAVLSNMRMSNELKQMAQTWEKEYKDPLERAKFMYRFVTSQIEPSREFYRDVNMTWQDKTGNATLLLAALFKEAGLTAHIVFTRSIAYEKVILDTPFPDLFFRALIQLKLPEGPRGGTRGEGQTVWLDANQKELAFGYISPDFFGAKAILLDPEQPAYIRVPSQNQVYEPVEASYRLVIQPEGDLKGWGEEKFYGMLAARLTPYYRELSETERLKNVETGVNERFPKSVVSEVGINEDLGPGQFALNYSFKAESWAKPGPDGIEVDYPLPQSPLRDHFANLASRNFPVEIDRPIHNIAKLSLMAPEGYYWSKPEFETLLQTPFGKYELKVDSVSDKEIELKRMYQLPVQEISPADYVEFQKFCQKILDVEQIKLKALPGKKP